MFFFVCFVLKSEGMPKKVYKKKVKSKINTVRRRRRLGVNRTVQPSIKRVILPPSSPIASLATSLGKKFRYVDHRMKSFNKQMNVYPRQNMLNSMISEERLENYLADVGTIPYGLQQRMIRNRDKAQQFNDTHPVINPRKSQEGVPKPGVSNQIHVEPTRVAHRPPPPIPSSVFTEDEAKNLERAVVLHNRPPSIPMGWRLTNDPRLASLLRVFDEYYIKAVPINVSNKSSDENASNMNSSQLAAPVNSSQLALPAPLVNNLEEELPPDSNLEVQVYNMADDGVDASKKVPQLTDAEVNVLKEWVKFHADSSHKLSRLKKSDAKTFCLENKQFVSMLFNEGSNLAVNTFLGIAVAPRYTELDLTKRKRRRRNQ